MSGQPERWFRKENFPKMTLAKEIQLIVGEIIVLIQVGKIVGSKEYG